MAAVEVVPLGFYLTRSPVWGDRERERTSPWLLSRPRLLDAACTALPYLYGSQRRGQPNLARALGVHNLNESAGGFAGLASLIWLAPLAWSSRVVQPRVGFLIGLAMVGFLGAFRLPPVDNLLRALPVLGVTDNRRLTLWLAFGLVMLGGVGLDALSRVRAGRGWGVWGWSWVFGSVALLVASGSVGWFDSSIRSRALDHYARASQATPGLDPAESLSRADRQVRQTLDFVPRYLALAGAQGLALAGLLGLLRRGRIGDGPARACLLSLSMVDLLGFGYGLNPAIDRSSDRPVTPLIDRLRAEVGSSGRIIGLGEELPPNTLMRYGLSDARNYDSVELTRNLDWLRPLYDPEVSEQSSRREITWPRVLAARDRLREAGVRAVVGPSPPPAPGFERSEKIGAVWVAWLDAADPMIRTRRRRGAILPGREFTGDAWIAIGTDVRRRSATRGSSSGETFDPGWRAEVDGRPVKARAGRAPSRHLPGLELSRRASHEIKRRFMIPIEVRGWG